MFLAQAPHLGTLGYSCDAVIGESMIWGQHTKFAIEADPAIPNSFIKREIEGSDPTSLNKHPSGLSGTKMSQGGLLVLLILCLTRIQIVYAKCAHCNWQMAHLLVFIMGIHSQTPSSGIPLIMSCEFYWFQ